MDHFNGCLQASYIPPALFRLLTTSKRIFQTFQQTNFRLFNKVRLVVALSVAIAAGVYLQHPQFGQAPSGQRLARIRKSPNYHDGNFQNSIPTPTYAEGHTFWKELYKSLFNRYPDREPSQAIPTVKTDLLHLPRDRDVVIRFGHASCFIQLQGKRILVDPVFNDHASPLPASVKAFKGTNTYSAVDLPDIDYLLITHDHYDHLDYETALALKTKTQKVICGLGVGAHFERWGYDSSQIVEKRLRYARGKSYGI